MTHRLPGMQLDGRVLTALRTSPLTRAQIAARFGLSLGGVQAVLARLGSHVERVEVEGGMRYRGMPKRAAS